MSSPTRRSCATSSPRADDPQIANSPLPTSTPRPAAPGPPEVSRTGDPAAPLRHPRGAARPLTCSSSTDSAGERGYPGRLRRRDHTIHLKIISTRPTGTERSRQLLRLLLQAWPVGQLTYVQASFSAIPLSPEGERSIVVFVVWRLPLFPVRMPTDQRTRGGQLGDLVERT
jgi:hypothetical protein